MKIRLGVNTPPANYADGQILTAQNINDIVTILKGAINNNYDDLVKIIAGDNAIHVFDTLAALQEHATTLTAGNDGDYGLVLDFPNEVDPTINSLRLYTFDFATTSFVLEKDNLSFIDIINKQIEIEAYQDALDVDFPNGIKSVTDDIYIQLGTKVDKETGKALSTNDFTTTLKNKLDGIASGAQVNVLESIKISGYGDPENRTDFVVDIAAKQATIDLSAKADLVNGFIPISQLPDAVDQIVEVANFAALPPVGEVNKIYITLDDHLSFRWGGTEYVEISKSLALGTTSGTAFAGDLGQTAYTHAITTGSNPHATNINQLAGTSLTSPTTGQVIKWDGTQWAKGTDLNDNFYISGASFNINTGVLTLTGAGGQANLTPDLDGRYYITTSGRLVWADIDLPNNLVDYGLSDLVATKDHLHDDRYPVLVDGKLPDSYLPPLAITKTHVVADQTAQDALIVQEGDVAVRTDLKKSFIYTGTAWQELLTPTDVVLSVNGKTGVITLTPDDIGSPSDAEFAGLETTVTNNYNALDTRLDTAESDIDALEGRATALETDSHTHANKSTLDTIAGIQTSITSATSEYDNQLATIGAIKLYTGNPDSTWEGEALFLRTVDGDFYPDTQATANTAVIRGANGVAEIGYDNSDSTLIAETYKTAIDELDLKKANVSDLSSNIFLYPTTANSPVTGYFRMVSSLEDPDYNDTAVDVSTGTINTTPQLIASLASDQGLFTGNPGVISVTTIGKIRKTGGNANQYAEFYFTIYRREANGTEHLVGTSDTTGAVNPANGNYYEFSASSLLNNGDWTATDRVVIKYYANALSAGASYDFQFGGTTPVRTLLPVPVSVIPSDLAADILVDTTSFNGILTGTEANVQLALNKLDDHIHDDRYPVIEEGNPYTKKSYVDGLLGAADAMIFKGTIGTGGTVTALPVPYQAGWTYKVITAGTYAGKNTEVGDLLVATADQNVEVVNSEWTVVQTNIDGAVTGPVSSTDNHVAIFDGATGKIIKDSGFTLGKSVPTDAVFTDTVYTHPTGFSSQPTSALTGASVISQVTVDTNGHVTGTSTRNLTPSDIGAASSTDLSTLAGVVDTKVTANANITGATHTKITYDAKGLVTAGGSLAESDIPMLPIDKITNLQTNLDAKATTVDYSTTLPSTGWSGSGPFTIDVTTNLGAITSTDKPIIDLDMTSVLFADVDTVNTEWAKVYRAVSGTSKITFYAKEVPTVALALQVKVVK